MFRKLFFVSVTLMLANIPLNLYASNLALIQTIDFGELTMAIMPTDISFPPIEIDKEDVENFAIPDISHSDELEGDAAEVAEGVKIPNKKKDVFKKIVIEDLRFKGGFSLQIVAEKMINKSGPGSLPVENIGLLTFHENKEGMKKQSRVTAETSPVKATLNGDPSKTENYKMFESSQENSNLSLPLTILNGNVTREGKGRIGQWEVYPAFKLKLPANLTPGTYAGKVTYTLLKA